MNVPDTDNLAKLPVELLYLVFDFIVRPSDLKALCLVSKAVSGPAFQSLYRKIVLPYRVDDRAWVRVEKLCQSQHLHHIQSIDIGHSDLPRYHGFCRGLQPLLQRIPEGALKSFTYGLHSRPQAEDLITVWREQRNLRKLQFDFNLYAPSLREIVENLKDDLQSLASVEELEVDFGEENDEELSLALFDILHLEKLRNIKMQYVGIEEDAPPAWSDKFSSLGSTLVSQRFPHTLTRISLWFVSLPSPKDWQLNDYHSLSALELYECSNIGPIMDGMNEPKLKIFDIHRRAGGDTASVYRATRSFLKRFGSLENLSVDIDYGAGSGERLAPAIREHGLHLKSLRVDKYKEEPGALVLHENLETFPQIEYLALPLKVEMMVEQCVEILRQLRRLEVLVVYLSIANHDDYDAWYATESRRCKEARECATKIFSQMPTDGKLRLLVFDKGAPPSHLRTSTGSTAHQRKICRHCFIQTKDEMAYGGLSSANAIPEQGETLMGRHEAVELDKELANYMFPGEHARILR